MAPAPVIRADWSDLPTLDDLPDIGEPGAPVESAPGHSLRDAMNAAIPLRKPAAKPAVGAWLEGLRERLEAAGSRDEVEGLILSADVCKASTALTGAARARLRSITTAALARWPEPAPRAADDSLNDEVQF